MIHFGIIGAGDIARKFADAVRQLDNAEVIAVASKSLDRAQEWAAREHIPSYYGNYAELLANPRIDAVYIATTTNAHYDNILQCLQAGKHVLCEKSLVRSAHEALTVCSLSKQKNLFLMEAMWTRFLPKTITAKQWIREGRIGKVKLMQATIGWKADPVYNKRLFDPALGGGSLYDLGIYPLEVLPYLVDEKILDMDAFVARHSTGVDDLVSMNLQLESCIANLQCSFTTKMPWKMLTFTAKTDIFAFLKCTLVLGQNCITVPMSALIPLTAVKKMDLFMKWQRSFAASKTDY